MGFIIVNKNTGNVIGDKIYTTKGRAEGVIKKASVSDKYEWVVIPMPSESTLKTVANGGWFSCVTYGGRLPISPIERD